MQTIYEYSQKMIFLTLLFLLFSLPKVTDIDSPTGDHALIDIGKLVGLNPRAVTVRTKSRESTSNDSQPTPIPSKYLNKIAFTIN